MRLPVLEDLGPVDYASATPPTGYHCGKCGVHGVKLWREYNVFLNHQSLLCAACACDEQSENGKAFTVSAGTTGRVAGRVVHTPDPHGLSSHGGDQIGWRIPAVPTSEGDTYWGYSSVPDDGVTWWQRLPLGDRR